MVKNVKIGIIKDSRALYSIRHQVLWQHKTLENCGLDVDNEPTTFHVGAKNERGEIVGTSTFIVDINKNFEEQNQYRLRAMATDSSVRGMGVGKKIIDFAIQELKNKNVKLLWCDARLIATGFYENFGFQVKGEIYEVPLIGPHKLMYIEI